MNFPVFSQLAGFELPLGEEFLNVPIAQCEAQVEPDRMLDDHRRKAVAAIGDFRHRASLPAASLSGYPGYPDKAAPVLSWIKREWAQRGGIAGSRPISRRSTATRIRLMGTQSGHDTAHCSGQLRFEGGLAPARPPSLLSSPRWRLPPRSSNSLQSCQTKWLARR